MLRLLSSRAFRIILPLCWRYRLNVYINKPQQKPQACVIWMHGLGADGQDMRNLAEQLPLSVAVKHVFLDAPVRAVTINNAMPMRAWYYITGLTLTDREDKVGILQSDAIIQNVIAQQISEDFSSRQIFLAGFSQGGAMALFSGLRSKQSLAGVITLSGYLPLAIECNINMDLQAPIFMACGSYDSIVLPTWTRQSYNWLRSHDVQHIAWHEYPMDHTICAAEARDLTIWLNNQVSSGGMGI
jgi:phospholipase/carboxylesterase